MSDYSPAQLQQVHASVTGFFQDVGCELLAYGPEHATLALDLLRRHLNNASNMHGGVMATLMDVAMGLSGTWEADPADRRVAMTLSMNINFSQPAAAGSRIRALAPTSVAVAILTRELPGLSWGALLPFGLLGGAILLLFGWPTENRRLQQLVEHSRIEAGDGSGKTSGSLRGLLIGSLIGVLLIALLAALTWLSATQAAMLLVPSAVIVILLWQGTEPAQVFGEVRDTLVGMRNETFIFASSALLAGLVAAVLPVHHLADQLGNTPLALFALGTCGALAVIALALLGVAPLISLNLCAALLAQLASQGLAVMQPAVALLFGFSLAMLLSPYGPSALLLARHAQLSPWRIAVGWNGRFVLSVLLPLLLIPLLA